MFRKRLLPLLVAFLLGTISFCTFGAQVNDLPHDQGKLNLTLYGDPADKDFMAIGKLFYTDAEFKEIQEATHFHAVNVNSPYFAERHAGTTPKGLHLRLQSGTTIVQEWTADELRAGNLRNLVIVPCRAALNRAQAWRAWPCIAKQTKAAVEAQPVPKQVDPPAPPLHKPEPVNPVHRSRSIMFVWLVILAVPCVCIGAAKGYYEQHLKR